MSRGRLHEVLRLHLKSPAAGIQSRRGIIKVMGESRIDRRVRKGAARLIPRLSVTLGSWLGYLLLQRPIIQEIRLNLAQPTRSPDSRFTGHDVLGHIDIEQFRRRYPDKESVALNRIHHHLRVPVQYGFSPLGWWIDDIARHTARAADIWARHRLPENVGDGPLNRLRDPGDKGGDKQIQFCSVISPEDDTAQACAAVRNSPGFNLRIHDDRPHHQCLELRVIFPVQRVALHNQLPVTEPANIRFELGESPSALSHDSFPAFIDLGQAVNLRALRNDDLAVPHQVIGYQSNYRCRNVGGVNGVYQFATDHPVRRRVIAEIFFLRWRWFWPSGG